ncbi:Y-family DNA polymerase [Thalassomonas sp. M1454]|uniref:Y-family DNA polymerase n=1 Tax=Thalassomonas sp. M1454 TaxID=2594477 RepID=UPI00118078FC|nr:Y-family DNA polymerase [Thalassomonas sp. M1454]TRX54053.1 Y-family DNA polymerase [Thalassomonas sp. M1454]
MYALVDAVAFYASAEKVFDPTIRNKPVVVLTNNDGCICAVCPIARKLGIPKFIPFFKIRDFLYKHNVIIRSSNYELYADLSEKMMNVIGTFCDNQYIYSIDESFLNLKSYSCINDLYKYGQEIRRAVWQQVKLPVGVGFGLTPTLSKAANHAAKKLSGFNGVAVINSDQSKHKILQRMKVDQVWGIGSRLGKKLNLMNIHSALDLANQDPKNMRKQFSVTVERTVSELNGMRCLDWDDIKSVKKEIFSTRSFGQRITDFNEFRSALIFHAYTVAKKARAQSSLIKRIVVFGSSSPHDNGYYTNSVSIQFTSANDNTLYIAQCVAKAAKQIYAPNVRFYKCGVGAIELTDSYQLDLFSNNINKPELMQCLDSINNRYGTGTLMLGSMKPEKWAMKRDFMSPQYTTNWHDIPIIEC